MYIIYMSKDACVKKKLKGFFMEDTQKLPTGPEEVGDTGFFGDEPDIPAEPHEKTVEDMIANQEINLSNLPAIIKGVIDLEFALEKETAFPIDKNIKYIAVITALLQSNDLKETSLIEALTTGIKYLTEYNETNSIPYALLTNVNDIAGIELKAKKDIEALLKENNIDNLLVDVMITPDHGIVLLDKTDPKEKAVFAIQFNDESGEGKIRYKIHGDMDISDDLATNVANIYQKAFKELDDLIRNVVEEKEEKENKDEQ